MKKTFNFTASKKSPERQADSIKHEIKKYLTRERNKTLPEKVDYWDFDCKFGDDENSAEVIVATEINACISRFLTEKKDSFYIEILVKHGHRTPKPKKDEESVEQDKTITPKSD